MSKQATYVRGIGDMKDMENTIWFAVFMGIMQYAAAILVAIAGFFFALTCFAWAIKMYDMLKEQCSFERLLDTPQEETDTKMEGNTTYCYPQDEGPLTRICPLCGALYPSYKVICADCKSELQPFRKPVTEPLPVLQAVDTLLEAIPSDIKDVWEELELTAEYYNRGKPCHFSKEEVLKLCALESKWRCIYDESHQEKRAS
jgi:hypothetical protein